jgi:Bacterial extracellular solute-binding proteins, family 5 Middle
VKRRQFLSTAAATIGVSLAPLSLHSARASDANRVLKFIPQSDLAILDPLATTAYVTRNHALMVFDTLFGVDEQYNAKPQMIEGYTVENEGKLWRLTLREGLMFHDNEPVLSKDVVASIKRWGKREMDRPVNLVGRPLYCARHCSAWRLRHCRIDPGLSWPAEPSTRHASTIRSIRMCSRNCSGRGSETISLGWCSSALCAVS